MKQTVTILITTMLFLGTDTMDLAATGLGPVFGPGTAANARGQISSNTSAAIFSTSESSSLIIRQIFGYGITENLQTNISFPLTPVIDENENPPAARTGGIAGSYTDIEGSLMWRFHRNDVTIGSRYESTLHVSGSLPLEKRRGEVKAGPSLHAAAVTGYVSRTFNTWIGAGYQRYFSRGGDRIGDLPYLTAVAGYRPLSLNRDYPNADWLILIESIAEFPRRDRAEGIQITDSGGEKILAGPSVHGFFGRWGISGGILFPALQSLKGDQPKERFRMNLIVKYWF